MGEKVTLAEAAKRIERSVPTLRRWASQGHLTKHDGPRAAGGRGSPLVLVDMDEVLLRAVALGLQMEPAKQPEPEPPEQPAMPSSGDGDPTVADLRAERDHFREMVTAKDAELEQLRALASRGWFSRVFGLLSGPTDG